jgi:TrkA domain protein
MAGVDETSLPGVGVRYDFQTADGTRLGVLVHKTGRREVFVYDRRDPDACKYTLDLSVDDARTLAEVLGTSQVVSRLTAMQQEIEGLTLDWITVSSASTLVGESLRSAAIHTVTGASVVAIVRGEHTMPSPRADERIEAGDVLVSVGTLEGVRALDALARG